MSLVKKDCALSSAEIAAEFGPEITTLVPAVTTGHPELFAKVKANLAT